MNTKYLSLTAALLVGCSNSVQQAKTTTPTTTSTITIKPARPDCSKLDLTQKVGFSTIFDVDNKQFRYRINQKEKHYYDEIYQCDNQLRPLPDHFMVMREFAGPREGAMQINAVLSVYGEKMDYVPFWRDQYGVYGSIPGQALPQPELEDMFTKGRLMLDNAKKLPDVCQKLLKYTPQPNLAISKSLKIDPMSTYLL